MAMKKHRPAPRPLLLRYLYGGIVQYRPGDRLAPRVLPDYEVVLMIEGTATYVANGTEHRAPPGSVILGRPGVREHYLWDVSGLTRHAYFHFDIEHLPGDLPAPERWPTIILQPELFMSPLIRHLIHRIAAHPEWPTFSPEPDECRIVECLLRVLLHPVEGPDSSNRQWPEPIQQALNVMRQRLDEHARHPLPLRELARRAGVSDKHLCRLFQAHLGHPPMRTYLLLKLQLAMAMLGRSNLAIKEIADRCGFGNPLYFTRCFTRVYGRSPTETRRALLRMQAPPPNPLPPDIMPRMYW
jgi:AraC-like DNA-binding protein